MVLLDSNTLLILIIGLIDPRLINSHRRTSLYDEDDFKFLQMIIDGKELLIIPNIWTEVDNLLNDSFSGNHKEKYIEVVKNITTKYLEKYIETKQAVFDTAFYDLALTDSLVLILAKNVDYLVTSDSKLSDYAKASNIKVIDLKEIKNKSFLI